MRLLFNFKTVNQGIANCFSSVVMSSQMDILFYIGSSSKKEIHLIHLLISIPPNTIFTRKIGEYKPCLCNLCNEAKSCHVLSEENKYVKCSNMDYDAMLNCNDWKLSIR